MLLDKLPELLENIDLSQLVFCARCLSTERDPEGNINYFASLNAADSGFVIETQVMGVLVLACVLA